MQATTTTRSLRLDARSHRKVGLDGKVTSASVVSSTMDSRPVESCITREISRLNFARPDGGICVINYPFVFTGVE